MPTKHFEHLTPIEDKPVTPQLSEPDAHVEVVEDKGRVRQARAGCSYIPGDRDCRADDHWRVRGNAVRSALLKTIAGLVTAKGQLFVATADNDTGALTPPSGTGMRSPAINASSNVWSYPANLDAQIDAVAASKVTGTLATARIPNLNASKINAGTLGTGRIPNLAASKITSGSFATARIPNLNANKITSGTLAAARLPSINAAQVDGFSFRQLTQAEYDALTPDGNTFYAIVG